MKSKLAYLNGKQSFIVCIFLFSFLINIIGIEATFAADKGPQTITVVGTGATKDAAIQDALRNAVERASGVFVYSVTDVKDLQIEKDKIVASSSGYVTNYKVIKEDKSEDTYFLTISVTVDVEGIKTILRNNIKAVTYDEAIKDYNLVTQKQLKLQKFSEMLGTIMSRPLEERYSLDYAGYKIEDVGLKSATIILYAHIGVNPFYWDTLAKIIQQGSDCSDAEQTLGGLLIKEGNQNIIRLYLYTNPISHWDYSGAIGFCIHRDMKGYFDNYVAFRLKQAKGGKTAQDISGISVISNPTYSLLDYYMADSGTSRHVRLRESKYPREPFCEKPPCDKNFIGGNGVIFEALKFTTSNLDIIKYLSNIKLSFAMVNIPVR